jgi:heat shock protein HslJ
MKHLSLFTVLLLLALLAGIFTAGALPARELPVAAPAAAQAATAVVETPTAAPAEATQAEATPLPAASAGSTLAGTSWIMSSLNGALPIPDTIVTLQLGADGSASGSDGCNRYWTTFEQDGQDLTFKQPMAGTMMACEQPVMAQATEYQEALATVTSFLMTARQLVLFAGDDIVLTFIADVATLEGTSWDVINYNNGREAVVGVLEGAEITLNFDETDLNGNAGCNNYFAGYAVKGQHILIDPPGATSMFCETPEGVMEQEAAYLAALESAATFRIEGDQLWLRTAEDAIAVIAVKKEIVDLPAPEPRTPTGTVSGANVLNIRSGPGTNFPVIGAARNGDSGTIVGRSEDGRWWVVDAPSLPGGKGWVSADFVNATDAEDVPVVPSPPPPPPTPTRVPPPTARPATATPIRPTPIPPPQTRINFWADRTQINRGECTTLRWDVYGVRGVWVYPRGSDYRSFPRTGQGSEQVCPSSTTTYEMRVLLQDGSTQFREVTVNVTQPIAPPQPPSVTQPIAPPQPPPAGDPLTGTRWNVVNFNNGMGAVTGTIEGTTITLAFDAGRASGNAGCNTYNANYQAGGNVLTVERPNATMQFCETPDGVMQQEQQYLAALQSAATFSVSGDQLQIRSGSDALAVVATRAR